MRRDYKYVIFDVGGTLLRWGDRCLFAGFLAKHAIDVDAGELSSDAQALRDEMIRAFDRRRPAAVGMGSREHIAEFWGQVLAEALSSWGRSGYKQDLLGPLTHAVVEGSFDSVFEDAVETLERLRRAGYGLGIVSNWSETLPQELARLGLDHYFDFVIVSATAGVAKPAPEIFGLALERAGCAADEALYVGDHIADDCVGGRRAGLDVALIRRSAEVGSTPTPCTAVFGDLRALSDALLAPAEVAAC